MRGLEVDGVFYEGESDIRDQAVEYYQKLYQETNHGDLLLMAQTLLVLMRL